MTTINIKSLSYITNHGLHTISVGSDNVTAIRLLQVPTETESLRYEVDYVCNGREYKNNSGTYCGSSWSYVDESGETHASDYFLYVTNPDPEAAYEAYLQEQMRLHNAQLDAEEQRRDEHYDNEFPVYYDAQGREHAEF